MDGEEDGVFGGVVLRAVGFVLDIGVRGIVLGFPLVAHDLVMGSGEGDGGERRWRWAV